MPTRPNSAAKPAAPAKPVKSGHKPYKIAGIVIAVIIVLIIILVIVLPLVINPNDFKPQIAKEVQDKTGRELSISGNIKLSIFPWLGAEIGPMSLSNAPGFGNTPFASINETNVHVRFWPLLRGKIEVGTVKLDGLNLDLERDATGHNNWQDILEHLRGPASAAKPSGSASGNGFAILQIHGFSVSNSGLRWSDAQKHQQYTISNFNVDMGAFASGKPLRLSTNFDFTGTNPQLSGHVDFKGTVLADLTQKIYAASNAKLELTANGDAVPGGQVKAELLWQQAALNMDAGTLAMNGLSASAYGLKAQVDMEGRGLHESPNFNGSLKIASFSPREVLTELGHGSLADTRDPKALSRASGSLNFIATRNSATAQDLSFKLDNTTLTGTASVKDFKSKALAFNLTLDQIDADRYLPPQKAATPAQPREPTDINKLSIPVRTLRGLNMDGELHIGQLTLLNTHTSNLSVGVSAHKGLVSVNPLSAQLYGGSLTGSMQIDAGKDTPIVTENLALQNVQAGGLIQDMFKLKRLSGTANLRLNTRALGPTVGEIRHTLSGHMDFSFKNGAIEGVNVWDAIERAYALVKHQQAPPPAPKRTEFTDMHGSGTISHGVLDNRDFRAFLPFLNLSGEGKLDLAENTLDYSLKAHITGTPKLGANSDLSGLAGQTIPLRISGTLSNLSVRPDLGGAIHARVESEVNKKKSELKKKLKSKLEDILHTPPG
ncbi:MAG: AsmA family protein [Gammaproteobacteria bacterium]